MPLEDMAKGNHSRSNSLKNNKTKSLLCLCRETCEELDEDEKEDSSITTLWNALNADTNLIRGRDSSPQRPNNNRLM